MNNYIILFSMTALALLSAGCEKELDFKYHDIEPKTVIEATLTEEGAEITIRRTTPMNEPMDLMNITGADVTITDCTTDECLALAVDGQGKYVSDTPGVPGHEYRIEVLLDGARYLSGSTMTRSPKIEGLEFNWVEMPYDDVAALQVSIADNDPEVKGECYWVRLYRNGDPYMWSAVKDDMAQDGVINAIFTTTRKNTEEEDEKSLLLDGDLVEVAVTQVSRDFLDYLAAISSDSNGPQMFAGDFCLGYFLAGEVSRSATIFHPDKIQYASH